MKNLKLVVLSTLMISCFVVYSFATQEFLVGQMQGWDVNNAWPMFDSGTGVFSMTTTIATAGEYGYKVVPQQGNYNNNAPGGSNTWFTTTTNNQPVTFWFSNLVDNTWSPASAVFWTSAQPATTYFAVGYESWAGNSVDFDAAYAGTQMTSIGNGIYQAPPLTFPTFNPSTAGSKQFKVAMNGNYSEQIGADSPFSAGGSWGFNQNGDTLKVSAFYQDDTITLQADVIHGRLRILHSHPAVPGPPWYAWSDIGSAALRDTTTIIYDDGTHGDAVAGDGIYSRSFVPTFTLSTHWFNIVDQQGNRHPTSANNFGAFYSASSGQTVLVTYDTNTYLDGWLPFTNIVYTSPTTTIGTHTFGVVGQNLTFFALGANDWDATLGVEPMNDSGTNGDLVAGDNIYTWQGVVIGTVTTLSQYNGKVILDGSYTLQIGSDGKSISGNPNNMQISCIAGDTIRFQCDVNKGRVTVNNLTHPATSKPIPSINGSAGQPGTTRIFSGSGGTPAYDVSGNPNYIGWTSSDPTKVQIVGFSGITATLNFIALGSSTVTLYDSLGQTAKYVANVVPTSAPLAPEFSNVYENRNTILWSIKE